MFNRGEDKSINALPFRNFFCLLHLRILPFDPCFAEHERNQNFKEDGIRFQIGVLKQRKRDLLKEDFQYFSRTEIEEAAGELQSDINRLHDELKAAGLEENKIISEILRRIEEVRDLPQRYLEAVDLREKGGILRELVSLLTLSDTEIQIHWKEPYSYLMREDLISAVSSGVAAARTPDDTAAALRAASPTKMGAERGKKTGEFERDSATYTGLMGDVSRSGKLKRGSKGRFERNYESTGSVNIFGPVEAVKWHYRVYLLGKA